MKKTSFVVMLMSLFIGLTSCLGGLFGDPSITISFAVDDHGYFSTNLYSERLYYKPAGESDFIMSSNSSFYGDYLYDDEQSEIWMEVIISNADGYYCFNVPSYNSEGVREVEFTNESIFPIEFYFMLRNDTTWHTIQDQNGSNFILSDISQALGSGLRNVRSSYLVYVSNYTAHYERED